MNEPTDPIQVAINGHKHSLEGGANLEEILRKTGFESSMVALAVNEEFIPKGRWKDFYLKNGDRLEVLAPMVGG